jgi:uncharacterized caspase-like protein
MPALREGHFMRSVFLIVAVFAFLVPQLAQAKRVALIIANGDYRHLSKLPNPVNDGRLIAQTLRAAGFAEDDITVRTDLDHNGMRLAILDFTRKAAGAEVALIYFAGHGFGGAENFLVPVDAKLTNFRDLRYEAFSQRELENAVSSAAGLKLVILDACRNDPSQGRLAGLATRSVDRGLQRLEPEGGVLVAYSAKHGTVAQDGSAGGNSPFALALGEHLAKPGRDIRFVFGTIRDAVLASTRDVQEPFLYGSLGGNEVYLVPPNADGSGPRPELAPQAGPSVSEAARTFAEIRDSDDVRLLEAWRSQYGRQNPFYDRQAEQRIAALRQADEDARREREAEARRLARLREEQEEERRQREAAPQYSYVWDTRPPDDFLALRSEPSSRSGSRLAKMPNGTLLEVLEKRPDGWWRVRAVDLGLEGWAKHANDSGTRVWISCCRSSAARD